MDFAHSDKVRELQRRVTEFMEQNVYPNEARFHAEIEANRRQGNAWVPTKVVEELKQKARAAGLWNLWLPESEFGAGLTNLEYAPLCEIMGRSHLGPEAFNCSAPFALFVQSSLRDKKVHRLENGLNVSKGESL